MPSNETGQDDRAIRAAVRQRYAAVAEDGSDDGGACCAGDADSSCCDGATGDGATSAAVGYDESDREDLEAADLGLGCGTPVEWADLASGETVLDLGCGGGFDCLLAAETVGPDGRVIGVDMTPEMVERARENAEQTATDGRAPVSIRLGEIEHLPVADGAADVVISNCVVNLSPSKPRVFEETYRALAPGGRVAIADVIRTADLPPALADDLDALSACVAGAATPDRLRSLLPAAGFVDVSVAPRDEQSFVAEWDPDHDLREVVTAARIEARKPGPG